MKLIAIIVSTQLEAGIIIRQLQKKKTLSIQGKAFYKGMLKHNIPIILSICGAGKTNAAHGTTLLLERFKPELVYVIGVAGAYPSSELNIGDIAIAEKEIYGDEGLALKSGLKTMDSIGLSLVSKGTVQYYNEFPMSIPAHLKGFAKEGTFVTVSACTGTLERGKEIKKRFNALCENMEGAAVAHICLINDTPVVEMRGISNIIQDRKAAPLKKSDILKASENVQQFFLTRIIH